MYRAATRTFHSTRILRHLFTVHATLVEFKLAVKALNTYFDLVSRGKARMEKSGKNEIGLDDEGTVLSTVAAGLEILCIYGRREEGERAQQLVKPVEQWLHGHEPDDTQWPVRSANDVPHDLVDQRKTISSPVSRDSLASAHRGIGISHGRWARLTYQSSERGDVQAHAIASFEDATRLSCTKSRDLQTFYNLALAYAESRDINAAIASVKKPLSILPNLNPKDSKPSESGQPTLWKDFKRRRTLLRCWHLLAYY